MNLSPLNTLIRQARARVTSYVEGGRDKEIGAMQFAVQFRTLNFNLGRGAGHSSYVREDFADGEDIAIVHRVTRDAWGRREGVVTTIEEAIKFMRGKPGFRDIWIDEPTNCLKTQKDVDHFSELIRMWAGQSKYKDGLIIMLGSHHA